MNARNQRTNGPTDQRTNGTDAAAPTLAPTLATTTSAGIADTVVNQSHGGNPSYNLDAGIAEAPLLPTVWSTETDGLPAMKGAWRFDL